MKVVLAIFVYILAFTTYTVGMQKDGAPSTNKYLNRENPYLKARAKQSLFAQNPLSQPVQANPQQSTMPASDTTPKSLDDLGKLLEESMARVMKDDYSANEYAAMMKMMQDSTANHMAQLVKKRLEQQVAYEKEMAALNARKKEQDEIHNAQMAQLDAQLEAQNIRFAQEDAAQEAAIKKAEAELAADDAAFQIQLAALKAAYQLRK